MIPENCKRLTELDILIAVVPKVQHYWLEVNAMTKPMMVREAPPPSYWRQGP